MSRKQKKKAGRIRDIGSRYKNFIINKVPLRIHMSLILMCTALTGVLSSKLLFMTGLNPIWLRYLSVVIISYLFFIIYIRLWLAYIGPGDRKSGASSGSLDLSITDLSIGSSSSAEKTAESGAEISGKGGEFGGGGGTVSWEDGGGSGDAVKAAASVSDSGGSGSGSGSGFDLDIDGDATGPILVLIIAGALILAVFGGAVYLIYEAPMILSEASFEVFLAAGLLKSTKEFGTGNWIGSVFKKTWIPFTVIAAVSVIAGAVLSSFCPNTLKLMDAIRSCT